jgi:hypothetical protein
MVAGLATKADFSSRRASCVRGASSGGVSFHPDLPHVSKERTDLGCRLYPERLLPFGSSLGRRFAHDAVDDREIRPLPGDPLRSLAGPSAIGCGNIGGRDGWGAGTEGGQAGRLLVNLMLPTTWASDQHAS